MPSPAVLPVPGFPHYLIGDDGTVWTTKRKGGNDRSAGKVSSPRPLKATANRRGYMQVSFDVGGKVVTRLVHTLVLTTFVGPRPKGGEACHYPNVDPADNRLENLRWDTHCENTRDKYRLRMAQFEATKAKCCTRCKVSKLASDFYGDTRSSDGLKGQCKKCHMEVSIATRNEDIKRANNREYMRRARLARSAKTA